MDYLDQLNAQQREAVTTGNGQILVLAGPGSGKTRVLTQRIIFLMKEMGVRPYNILAVTFTNKAAKEMQTRVEDMLKASVQGAMWIGTFHAICARIMRREAALLPINNSFVIMDADDQETLIKRIIKDLNLDDKTYRPRNIQNAISNAKNALMFPQDVPRTNYREEALFRIYEQYQKRLEESNSVDFDDLLLWTFRLLRDNPQIRESYGTRFQHILVDEFQDTNMVQYQLIRLLGSVNKNLFVVGDEDQSIYRWRGADYRNILQFEKDYPDCKKILLEQNYRSTQNVLDAAVSVINKNQNRTKKKLFSERGSGDKITLYEAEDDRMEARYVVDTIAKLIKNGNARGGDFAVLYRTNAQSRLIEDAFLNKGMAYRLIGAQRFYGRREVKDLIAYLRVAFNPHDAISLGRIINTPPRGIGAKTIANLNVAAGEAGKNSSDVLFDLGRKGPESYYWQDMGRGALPLADLGSLIIGWREQMDSDSSIVNLMDRIIKETGYQGFLTADDEDEDRWENVEELRKMAFEYEERGLSEFLQNLALVSDQDTITENTDSPTLMTLHAVKGLEFNRVFIIGLDEGILPHSRSLDDPEEMAEERRLFYVGLTRARNQVTLVRADQRMAYGMTDVMTASRFLRSIPEELIYHADKKGGGQDKSSKKQTRWESMPSWSRSVMNSGEIRKTANSAVSDKYGAPSTVKQEAPKKTENTASSTQFKPLDKVTHKIYGDGIVLESKADGSDEIVTIQFKTVGLKKLVAGIAGLQKKG